MSKKLRIATTVTGHFTTPPPAKTVYAPMDVAIDISEGLTKKGHQVDFFAPKGSKVNVSKMIDAGLNPLRHDGGQQILNYPNVRDIEWGKIFNLWDQYMVAQMFKAAREGKYDILHVHPVDRSLPIALSNPDIPVVYTLHDPIFDWRAEIFKLYASPNQFYVSISNAQRKPAPDLNYAATVYNGIRLDQFPFSDKNEDYVLFVGRLHPEKGVAEAVQAALKADERLIIIGPPVTGEYWDKQVKPYIGGKIEYLGHVPREKLFEYYQNAKATLVPIKWEEPFGLVITESMACGTPVIAFRRGSVPEIVQDGRNGFIVDNVDQMVEKIKEIESISPHECRKSVEEQFGIGKMIDGYEKVFFDVLESWPKRN